MNQQLPDTDVIGHGTTGARPRVSVVIVNYNVRDLLLNCVRSLERAFDGIPGEVIVVDNASSDGAIAQLNHHFPDVITIQLEENLGFGGANNIGIERAGGEYILLLNPDTIVEESTIEVMLEFMSEHPDAAFASSKVILPDGSFDKAAKRGFPSPWSSFCRVFGLSKMFPKSKLFGGYNLTYLDPDEGAKVEAICGCFMFCRADVLKDLGGFDTDFFMYGEDLDLCYRARKAGWEIYYHPATTIVHIKGESTRRSSLDALAMFYEAMEVFARKHFRSNLLLLMLVRAGIYVRRVLARFGEGLPHWPLALLDALAVLAGLLAGEWVKAGSPLAFPDWAMPTVLVVPPLVFIVTIAVTGGYRGDDEEPASATLGYLLGFFVLTVLFTFFKEYQFGRSLLLVSTFTGAIIGVGVRFAWLVYRRTFGSESIRRVAFLGRQEVDAKLRTVVRRAFFGKPVAIVGTLVPDFSDADRIDDRVIGAVDNIARIVDEHRLTDIVVLDQALHYSEVTRAITAAGSHRVQFHIASSTPVLEELTQTDSPLEPQRNRIAVDRSHRNHRQGFRRLRDSFKAIVLLVFFWPVVLLLSSNPYRRITQLCQVILGRRRLVGGAPFASGKILPPMFTVAELCGAEAMSQRELMQLEEYYLSNQSLVLDTEIIVASVRARREMKEARGVRVVEDHQT